MAVKEFTQYLYLLFTLLLSDQERAVTSGRPCANLSIVPLFKNCCLKFKYVLMHYSWIFYCDLIWSLQNCSKKWLFASIVLISRLARPPHALHPWPCLKCTYDNCKIRYFMHRYLCFTHFSFRGKAWWKQIAQTTQMALNLSIIRHLLHSKIVKKLPFSDNASIRIWAPGRYYGEGPATLCSVL